MRASTNNRATTVLEVFLDAVRKWGVPSRQRGDHGGENILVAVWMIMYRGPNRASFMWGSYVIYIFNSLDIYLICVLVYVAVLRAIHESNVCGLKSVLNLLADGVHSSCVWAGSTA